MTTYSKETALYDTGAIGDDIEEAGQTAERYITQVDSNGIKVHAQNNPTTNYSLINANGLTVYKGGNDVATFGDTARVGKSNSSRFLMNASSLQAYNSSNSKYFEVSSTGMTYGSNTVASTSYADGKASAAQSGAEATAAAALAGEVTRATAAESDAATKATNYITQISQNQGIWVTPSDHKPDPSTGEPVTTGNNKTRGWRIKDALEMFWEGISYIWAGIVNNIATVRVGKETGGHSVIDENGMRVYGDGSGNTQLANIGYGSGTSSSGGASDAPYYTLGHRIGTIGNYSVAEGYNTVASGYASHAEGGNSNASGNTSHTEGQRTIAEGLHSHAEGHFTKASGDYSHSEGWGLDTYPGQKYALASGVASHAEGAVTTASGYVSHAEGYNTVASGSRSHAQNLSTIAAKTAQTSIGTFNIEDTATTTSHPDSSQDYGDYAFIIGNGTASDARSNALTVDWVGNVEAAGAFFANGAEFSKQASNHLVIGGYHVCWGSLTVSSPTLNAYAEQTVTLPYTYTSAPFCMASCAGRAARHRTAYASQGDQTGDKIRVGYYATATGAIYINYLTIGV